MGKAESEDLIEYTKIKNIVDTVNTLRLILNVFLKRLQSVLDELDVDWHWVDPITPC